MRSLQVIGSPGLGGAEQAFVRLADALDEAGVSTTRVVRRDSRLAAALGDGPAVRTLPLRGVLDLRSLLALRELARDGAADVVQSWMTRATWLTRAPRGCVHVARLGGYYRPRYFRHADAWVANTRGLRDWLIAQGFPAKRVRWIHNFLPDTPLPAPRLSRAALGIPPDAQVVIAMGRLRDKKGFQDLIPAFASLPARLDGRPLHLVLMGYGEREAALRALAAPLADRVHFTGWIDDAVAELPLGDVFVCPSREEPFGNVMMEAWRQARPVISTRTAGGNEMIEDGVTGLLVPVADPAALAAALRRTLQSAALRAELAARGHEALVTRYSRDAAVAGYLAFYDELRRAVRRPETPR